MWRCVQQTCTCKTQMARCNKHGQCFWRWCFISAGPWGMNAFTETQVGFTRVKPVSTLFDFFLGLEMETQRLGDAGTKGARRSGGLPSVPDVSVSQHSSERLATQVCSGPPLSTLRHEASNHICFHSKQSRAGTGGSLSLLLKAFWGPRGDGPDGVIYPGFAECDVYGHGIPISHRSQDTYAEGPNKNTSAPQAALEDKDSFRVGSHIIQRLVTCDL